MIIYSVVKQKITFDLNVLNKLRYYKILIIIGVMAGRKLKGCAIGSDYIKADTLTLFHHWFGTLLFRRNAGAVRLHKGRLVRGRGGVAT